MEDNPHQTVVSESEVQLFSAEIKTNVDFGNDQQGESADTVTSNIAASDLEAKSTPWVAIDSTESKTETENTDLTVSLLDESQYVREHTLVRICFVHVC